MSAADILANMSRGWNRDPSGVALGTERMGVSAALWTHQNDDVQEVQADPDPTQNIIALQLGSPFAEVRFDGRTAYAAQVPRGGFQIVAAGVQPHMITRGPWQILHLYLPQTLVTEIAASSQISSFDFLDPKCEADPEIQRIGLTILEEMRAQEALSRLRIDLLGQELSIHLLRRWSSLTGTTAFDRVVRRGGLAPWQVRRITEYMEEHLADDVGLEDLSRLVDLSTFHLCRAFKQSTGLPPHRWRHQRRIERARELLEGTDLPVTEVAAQVGYDDPSQLAAAFRKALGVSPSQYRRDRRS